MNHTSLFQITSHMFNQHLNSVFGYEDVPIEEAMYFGRTRVGRGVQKSFSLNEFPTYYANQNKIYVL